MKALLIPPSTFTERTIYKGPGCTNPTSLRLSFARETCFENPCDSILQGAVRCPTQNTLSQDTKSLFPDNNVVTMNIYVDDNCAAFDYSESIRLDVCQPFSSLNPDAINGEAIKATLSGSTYRYSVYSDSECKQLLQALVLGTDGSCGRTSGVVSGRVTSVKGMDPSAYTASLSSSGGGGSGGSSGSSGSSNSSGSSSSGGNGGSAGGSTGGTGGSVGGNTGSTSATGSTSSGTSGSGSTTSNTSGTTGNSGSTNGNGKIPSGNTSTNPPSTAADSNSPSPAFIGGIAAAIVVTLLVVIGAVVYTRRARSSKSNVEAPKSTFPPKSPSPKNTLRTDNPTYISPIPKEDDQDSTLGRLSSTSPLPTRTETIHVMNMNTLPTDATLEKEKENPLFRNLIPAIPVPSTSVYPSLKKSEKDSAPTANPNESPESWTIEQVAEWVSQNGGSREPVFEQRIDGMALTALSVEDLYTVLKISTVGDRLKFRRGLEALLVAPPTYTE
ncbi:hypothetical protein HDU99_001147 [Rhizoclosmatium hyalinum]|nr:hypothetical protein HDU99_001147 [Rhizoclosmatium hyalinum]